MLFSLFQRSNDKKYYKNWTKEGVFVYIFGFIFHGVYHAKTDLQLIWLKFVFGSFFERDHLLNLIILGVYKKMT